VVSTIRIIGDGVIGLAAAVTAAARGHTVTLHAPALPGAASPASAGMLAPSVERSDGPAQAFSDAARAAWPRLLDAVRRSGDPGFTLQQEGILQLARSAADARRLQAMLRPGDHWLDAEALRDAAPQAAPTLMGAALFAADGLADVPSSLAALSRVARSHPGITWQPGRILRMEAGASLIRLTDEAGEEHVAEQVVLAAGAWSPTIEGLPRPLPITPLRGALVAVDGVPLSRPLYGPDGHTYLLPRGGLTVIGATSTRVGFDAAPGPDDAASLLAAGAALVPAIAQAPATQAWAGLRPMTPDGLPILGPDPDLPGLLYACGHSRNGFLHAALTAEVLADLLVGATRPDIAPLGIDRFTDPATP
jgi:glycine oxidase